jgi:hypothetical protein
MPSLSVENMNKFVKRTLGTVLSMYRLVAKDRNWTEVLGSIASAINLQHGRGKHDVSAYEAVYGQKWTMTSFFKGGSATMLDGARMSKGDK